MKSKANTLMKNNRSFPALASLAFAFSIFAAGQAIAQTWTGNTDALWDTDANWSGVPPASSGSSALIFNPANLSGSAVLVTSNDLTSFTATSITFDNSTTAGAYTLAGNQITLGGDITTTGSTGTPTHTLSLATILNGNRTITTALDNNLSISGIISQDIAGRSLTKAGAGTLTLSGANSYSGGTNINEGTVVVNSGGTLGATTGALIMGTGSDGVIGTVGSLTLNTSANVGALTVRSNTADVTSPANIGQLSIASGSTLTATSFTAGIATTTNPINTAFGTGNTPGAGGTLTVNGNVAIGQAGTGSVLTTTVVDLSGLNIFNVTSTGGSLLVGVGSNARGTLTLANNANTINVGTLTVGDSGGNNNYQLAGVSVLNLGAGTNALQAPAINIGTRKGAGQIQFSGSNGSVTITGANGVGTSNITIGSNLENTYLGNATNSLLLAGHTATVNAGTVIVSQKAGSATGGSPVSQVTFDTGTFNASSIQMSSGSAGNSGTSVTSTFTVGGLTANSAATGVVNVTNNILLADTDSNNVSATGTLTINGGTVNVNTAASASQGIRDNSNRTGGSGVNAASGFTTLTLQGGTLNLNGGIIGGDGSAGNRTIDTLNFRSGTLQNVGQINNGTTGLSKSTDSTPSGGTLILAGANIYSGATVVSAGTLLVNGTHITATASSDYAVNGNTILGGTGRLAVNGSVSVASTAILAPGASIGTLTLDGVNTAGNVLTMTTGSEFAFELAGNGGTPDQLAFWNYVVGDLALNSNAIDLSLLGTQTAGTYNVDIFRFFSDGGTAAATHAFASGLSIGSLGTGISSAAIDWDGAGNDNQTIALTYTVIPEPSVAMLGVVGTLALLRRRRNN